ncbi:MAG: hypothetical protein V1842_01055, partial [Candidatus Omnitrophota bacterium]
IKTKRLNKKRIQYIMTAKGFAEQTKKSYRYTLKTIEQFKLINKKIQDLVIDCHKKGIREIVILANKECTMMIEMAINSANLDGLKYRVIADLADNQISNGAVLFTSGLKINSLNSGKDIAVVDVIEYLANYGVYAWSRTERISRRV